jgi:hypothetical protein
MTVKVLTIGSENQPPPQFKYCTEEESGRTKSWQSATCYGCRRKSDRWVAFLCELYRGGWVVLSVDLESAQDVREASVVAFGRYGDFPHCDDHGSLGVVALETTLVDLGS